MTEVSLTLFALACLVAGWGLGVITAVVVWRVVHSIGRQLKDALDSW